MKKAILALFIFGIAACNMNYEKTPSGLAYKIFRGKDTAKVRPGEYAKFNMAYILADRDSVYTSTYGSFPAYSQIDTGKRVQYSFMEIMPLMHEGDSAEVSISIDTLKNVGILPSYNSIFVKGQLLTCKVQILKTFKNEKDMIADYEKSLDEEKDRETKALAGYMTKHNLKGIKTKNGAFVVVENAGDESMKADSGKLATVMYRGYLASNGTVFDTNMDSSKGHTEPIQVLVGSRGAIQGFSECLPYFGKGGKGKFLIPALLGYGGQPQGPDIPAYSNLIFDIEVTDVTDAPQQRMPQMPPSGSQH